MGALRNAMLLRWDASDNGAARRSAEGLIANPLQPRDGAVSVGDGAGTGLQLEAGVAEQRTERVL